MWLWSMPDPAKIGELTILPFGDLPAEDIRIGNVRIRPWNVPVGKAKGPLDEAIFPFVDQYGQYVHREWPGKIDADADLIAARRAEDADFKEHPGPADWDSYGGWAKGRAEGDGAFPHREGRGRWWLVDPEGRLFWSHGMTDVGTTWGTSVKNREHCYASLRERPRRAGWWNSMDAVIKKKYGATGAGISIGACPPLRTGA